MLALQPISCRLASTFESGAGKRKDTPGSDMAHTWFESIHVLHVWNYW